MRFVGMEDEEYLKRAVRHIWENHRDHPADEPIVVFDDVTEHSQGPSGIS
jgi:hypothetical protein